MKRLNCLLIDDSRSTNFFNKIMLEKSTICKELRIAENGKEALEVLNTQYIPDLIFLDINMPVMDGWTFLEEFQKMDHDYKECNIIIMIGAELPPEKKAWIKTIPNVKGCVGKMLTRETITHIITNFSDSTIDKISDYLLKC